MKNLGGGRGLFEYGKVDFRDGSSFQVQDSSSAGDYVWVNVVQGYGGVANCALHLKRSQLRRLIKVLEKACSQF